MQPVDKAQDRLGQRNAKPMQKALAESWSIQEVITHWTHLAPQSLMTRKQVADWLRIHLRFKNAGLNKTLATIYAEATVFAIDAANFRVRQAVKRNKAPLGSFDWDNWKPGNRAAALIVNPPEGLARRLEQRYRTIKDLNNTTVDRIGTILADGLLAGIGPRAVASEVAGELIDSRTDWADTLEERLKQVAQDQRRAEVIARTEMNRAVWDEKVDRYAEMGVTKVEWSVLTPCDDCAENDGAVVELGEPFPNGWTSIDDSHPNCNCTITPVLDDFFVLDVPGQGDDEDIELGALADLAKYSEDQERDESGRFGSGGGNTGLVDKYDPDKYDIEAGKVPDEDKQTEWVTEQQGEYGAYLASNSDFNYALYEYMDENVYAQFNEELRSGDYEPDSSTDKIAQELYNAVYNEGAVFDRDVTVYRGAEGNAELANLQVGDTFTDQSFTSTSTNPLVAETFANKYNAGDSVMMAIEIPSGTNALALEPIHATNGIYQQPDPMMKEMSGFYRLNEVLLPPGTTYQVTGVQRTSGQTNYQIKVVGQENEF